MRKKRESSYPLVYSRMTATVGAGQGLKPGVGNVKSRSSRWVAGTQSLEPSELESGARDEN